MKVNLLFFIKINELITQMQIYLTIPPSDCVFVNSISNCYMVFTQPFNSFFFNVGFKYKYFF